MRSARTRPLSRRGLIAAAAAGPAMGALAPKLPHAAPGDPLRAACDAWLAGHERMNEIYRTYGDVEARLWEEMNERGAFNKALLRRYPSGRIILSMDAELKAWPPVGRRLLHRIRRTRALNIEGVLGKLQIGADGLDAEFQPDEHRVLASGIADLKRLVGL